MSKNIGKNIMRIPKENLNQQKSSPFFYKMMCTLENESQLTFTVVGMHLLVLAEDMTTRSTTFFLG